MGSPAGCRQNKDPLRLVREGSSQEKRLLPALDPLSSVFPKIDDHGIADRIVFAQAYSAYLKFHNSDNAEKGTWQPFFRSDISVLLAMAAIQDVDYYRSAIKEYFDFLKDINNKSEKDSRDYLGFLFSGIGTLAGGLDTLKEGLPEEIPLKGMLQSLIKSQLKAEFRKLIAYYKADRRKSEAVRLISDVLPDMTILCRRAVKFSDIYTKGLSKDWMAEGSANWLAYVNGIQEDDTVYGSSGTVLGGINHISTHNLFTLIFDQFLKVYARVVKEASAALEETFTNWDRHEPHYALFLAFLHLFEYAREETNTLTKRHLDFYYREVLKLREKGAKPGKVHLLVELAKQAESRELKKDELLKAGKDDLGRDAFFAIDRDFVANRAKVAALKTVYRHKNIIPKETLPYKDNRIFASPASDSDDGLGTELTSVDQSWHPFNNKIYKDGNLIKINMPEADIGFAIASHYLLMAGGKRTVTVEFEVTSGLDRFDDNSDDIVCLFTTEKGWFEAVKSTDSEFKLEDKSLTLIVELSGADPAIVPYSAKTHGYNFATSLPIMLVKLRHLNDSDYVYPRLQDLTIGGISLRVSVSGLRTLAVSNDFGPIDTSKPFQPFGAQPVEGAGFTVGSKEVFQKHLDSATLGFKWSKPPQFYTGSKNPPKVNVSYLISGEWSEPEGDKDFINESYDIDVSNINSMVPESEDIYGDEQYSSVSRNGYIRLILSGDLGFNQYQIDLCNFLANIEPKPSSHPGPPILGPFANDVSIAYEARYTIKLDASAKDDYEKRKARFFHFAPFGQAERHPFLGPEKRVFLLPQFGFERDGLSKHKSEAEFYIGISDLKPPQNLSLLFELADGTADPLSTNPQIHWSYLSNNDWSPFDIKDVEDRTEGLLMSGIITFTVPGDASDANILLPAGMHWIRVAVADHSDAVCRLRMVAAQALEATFIDKDNDPSFCSKVLKAGTISKLDRPDAAVKKITQPFESYGGRGEEVPAAFYARVSERLRHKDRGIALWDYERLILEAFPQIQKAKCLNHTEYEPEESGNRIYRELAPGHVTVVTIPNLQFHNLRDPLRPYTSLGLQTEMETFLRKRLSCFVKLHVRNPQFEEVRVECKVRLHDGFDEAYHLKEMKTAITRFLSPWAFPGGGSPSFGGMIYKSVLINYIEDLRYVDYVTDFKLFHRYFDQGNEKQEDKDEIEGSKAVSILVSAGTHTTEAISPAKEEAPGEICRCKP